MKMAQGYVTDDGTFFESKTEAVLHEAEAGLRRHLADVSNGAIDADKFLGLVLEVMPALKGFIDAYNSAITTKLNQQAKDEDRGAADESEPAKVDAGLGHVSSTEEDLASLLKLPTRGPSHVPDVGSGPHAKEVSKRRAKHGAGGG
jgi:hypothetical protein